MQSACCRNFKFNLKYNIKTEKNTPMRYSHRLSVFVSLLKIIFGRSVQRCSIIFLLVKIRSICFDVDYNSMGEVNMPFCYFCGSFFALNELSFTNISY